MTDNATVAIGASKPDATPANAVPLDTQEEAGGDYNRMPYPSMPFADTQPAHLAALASLFGIAAPDVSRARVLELGCAAGGNIIPLAARFPEASFIGIDLSRRHIDDGSQRINELNLMNVSLLQADLTTLDLAGQQFDYVICHGVFSWVPKAAQDAIFRLSRQTLAPNGVLTISYNVLPGWHLRMAIRDLCLHYAGTAGTARSRVSRARAALQQIAAGSDDSEPYGLLLRTEARRLKNVPAAYILGEFLAPENTPCSVRDFVERASAYGFDYLCEVDLCAAVPQMADQAARSHLTAFSGIAAEQHIDFLTGRLFRRSVLVRRQLGRRVPNPNRLSVLHISTPVRHDAANSTSQVMVFTDDRARPITVKDPVIGRAIGRLATAFPATLMLDELLPSTAEAAKTRPRLCQAVWAMVLAGRATISVLPLRVGCATDERPAAWSVARTEAASGQPWLTSLCHAGVPAHPVIKALLPHLDGTNDRATLRDRFALALRDRTVEVPDLPAEPAASMERVDAVAAQYIEWALCHLERHALLEAVPPDAA